MNQEVKQKWVEALRSGKYGQAQSMLSDGHGNFCCLGVLCELAVDEGVTVRYGVQYGQGYSVDLPREVSDWAGFPDDLFGNVTIGESDAITMNDDKRLTFQQIADEIEKYL